MNIHPKLLALLALGLVAAAPAVRADDPSTPPAAPPPPAGDHPHDRMQHMRERRMKQLDEKLHLTADQKTQINAIWDKSEEQVRALWSDDSLSPQEKRAKMGELLKASHDQVRAVLTPDQQKIFDTLPPDRPMRRRPPPPPSGEAPPPPPPPAEGGSHT